MKVRLLTLIVLLLCCSLAFSQKGSGGTGGGSHGGTSTGQPTFNSNPGMSSGQGSQVQVRVAWNDEQRVDDEIVHLQLLSSNNVMLRDTFADNSGLAYFNGVAPGTYRIKADGPDINEVISDSFDIGFAEQMHMEWVHVSLKQNAQQKNVPGSGPMVSASELNAPPKAREEVQKSTEALAKGDVKKAEERLRKAIEIDPQFARAWNNLGVVLMRENNPAAAKEAFLKSIEVDEKFPSGYLNLARLSMREQKWPEADAYITKSLSFNPLDPEGLTLLAREELLSGQFEKALANARKVHTLPHDHFPDSHLIAGDALQRLNQPAEAVKEYELYLKEDPDASNAAQVRAAMAQLSARIQTKP